MRAHVAHGATPLEAKSMATLPALLRLECFGTLVSLSNSERILTWKGCGRSSESWIQAWNRSNSAVGKARLNEC